MSEEHLTDAANEYGRAAERYAAELINQLRVPHTYDEAVTMIALAYLEGGIAQLTYARNNYVNKPHLHSVKS